MVLLLISPASIVEDATWSDESEMLASIRHGVARAMKPLQGNVRSLSDSVRSLRDDVRNLMQRLSALQGRLESVPNLTPPAPVTSYPSKISFPASMAVAVVTVDEISTFRLAVIGLDQLNEREMIGFISLVTSPNGDPHPLATQPVALHLFDGMPVSFLLMNKLNQELLSAKKSGRDETAIVPYSESSVEPSKQVALKLEREPALQVFDGMPLSLRPHSQLLLLRFPVLMAPSNEIACFITESFSSLSNGKLAGSKVPLLSELAEGITIKNMSPICQVSSAPAYLFQQVLFRSHEGVFIGFSSSMLFCGTVQWKVFDGGGHQVFEEMLQRCLIKDYPP